MHVLSTPPAFVLSQDQTLRECLPRNRGEHHESGARGGIIPSHTASSLCVSSKEPRPSETTPDGRGINISGVDFWHAVEFSRNGRFLRTHRETQSLRLSSGRFPSVFPDSIRSVRPDFLGAFQSSAFAFPFPAIPTLSEILSRNFRPPGDGPGRSVAPGSPVGGAVNVLERGASMQIEAPRSRFARARS